MQLVMSRIFTSGLGEWRRSGRFSRADLVQPAAVGCQDEVDGVIIGDHGWVCDVVIFHNLSISHDVQK